MYPIEDNGNGSFWQPRMHSAISGISAAIPSEAHPFKLMVTGKSGKAFFVSPQGVLGHLR